MKKFLKWTKNNILLCTVLIMIALITCHFSLGIFNMGFRLSFIYSLSIFIVIGLIVGTIQLFRKKGKIKTFPDKQRLGEFAASVQLVTYTEGRC